MFEYRVREQFNTNFQAYKVLLGQHKYVLGLAFIGLLLAFFYSQHSESIRGIGRIVIPFVLIVITVMACLVEWAHLSDIKHLSIRFSETSVTLIENNTEEIILKEKISYIKVHKNLVRLDIERGRKSKRKVLILPFSKIPEELINIVDRLRGRSTK